jgi:hypothetical protein
MVRMKHILGTMCVRDIIGCEGGFTTRLRVTKNRVCGFRELQRTLEQGGIQGPPLWIPDPAD